MSLKAEKGSGKMVQQGSSEDIRFYLLPQPPENMKKNMQIRKKVTVEVNFCIVLLTCIKQGDVI